MLILLHRGVHSFRGRTILGSQVLPWVELGSAVEPIWQLHRFPPALNNSNVNSRMLKMSPDECKPSAPIKERCLDLPHSCRLNYLLMNQKSQDIHLFQTHRAAYVEVAQSQRHQEHRHDNARNCTPSSHTEVVQELLEENYTCPIWCRYYQDSFGKA